MVGCGFTQRWRWSC